MRSTLEPSTKARTWLRVMAGASVEHRVHEEADPGDAEERERERGAGEHLMKLGPASRRERPAHVQPVERVENGDGLPGRRGEPRQCLPAEHQEPRAEAHEKRRAEESAPALAAH